MLAPALQAIAAFNLICTGTLRTGPLGVALPEEGGEPIAITYRVDLAGNRWCSGACDAIEPLASLTDGVIVLREEYHPAGSSVVMVAPATGRFTDTFIFGDTAILRSGACEQAPFTGFPNRTA